MGIQNFYTWLKETYPNSVTLKNKLRKFDYIYVDVNHLLHNAMSKVNDEKMFISNLNIHLDNIFNNFIATRTIVLAVDGASPYGKVLLQRKRRKQGLSNVNVKKLNPLHLTPGTDVMLRLGDHMKEYVENLKARYKYVKPNFIISSTIDPDEGEIKIFRRLVEFENEHPHSSHLVVGNDADLVVLATAAAPAYNIHMFVRHSNTRILISIADLITAHSRSVLTINKKFHDPEVYLHMSNLKTSPIRDDFTVISIMLGNDYIPKLQFVKFETIWKSYRIVKKHRTDFLTKRTDDGVTFVNEFFLDFLSVIMTVIPRSCQRMKLTEYNEDAVQNYLDGLLWCLRMYQTGVCPKYDYVYEYKQAPNPSEVRFFLKQMKKPIQMPRSSVKPMNLDACVLLLMPYKAKNLVPKHLHKLMMNELSYIYEEELCTTCANIHESLSKSHKLRYKLCKERKEHEDEDNEQLNKQIDQTQKNITEMNNLLNKHKEDHVEFNVDDINKIIEMV